ncbi:MAG TPA: hypothetical protein VFE62_13665 [Gemmataceae bacterium]|nr:hypothetical protein [Gemmataceae bacterium]
MLGPQVVRDAHDRGMWAWAVVGVFALLSLLALWMAVRPFPPANPEASMAPDARPGVDPSANAEISQMPDPPVSDTAIKADVPPPS